MNTPTIRLDDKLDSDLRELAAQTGKGKSEIVREALRRQLAIARFNDLGRHVAPFARARGWLANGNVFEELS